MARSSCRESPAPRPASAASWLDQISDVLCSALGLDVEVAASANGAYRAHLAIESLVEAVEFARQPASRRLPDSERLMLEQHSPAPPDSALRMTVLRPEDEPALVALFDANDNPEVTQFFDPFPLTKVTAQRLVRYAGRDRYWGLWIGEQLVGLIMVRGWDGGHPHPTVGAVIDAPFRGGGLVNRAIDMVVEELSAMGETVLRAKFHEENSSSARVIVKSGKWKVISRGNGRVVVERAVPPA